MYCHSHFFLVINHLIQLMSLYITEPIGPYKSNWVSELWLFWTYHRCWFCKWNNKNMGCWGGERYEQWCFGPFYIEYINCNRVMQLSLFILTILHNVQLSELLLGTDRIVHLLISILLENSWPLDLQIQTWKYGIFERRDAFTHTKAIPGELMYLNLLLMVDGLFLEGLITQWR